MGEAVSKIFERKCGVERSHTVENLANLMDKYCIDVKRCLPPPYGDAFSIMANIRKQDCTLNNTDIMILSHVLADPDSKFFFST